MIDVYDSETQDDYHTGYFGIALARKDKQGKEHIIIASRGTELNSLKDWSNDMKIVLGKIPKQIRCLRQFERRIRMQYPNLKQIMFTGHSLGGTLSLLSYTKSSWKKDSLAVGFDSTGIDESIKKMKIDLNKLDRSRMITLNAAKNMVNNIQKPICRTIIVDNGREGDVRRSHKIAEIRRAFTEDGRVRMLTEEQQKQLENGGIRKKFGKYETFGKLAALIYTVSGGEDEEEDKVV